MKIILLTIGDELLTGTTVNTNAAWLGAELTAHGFTVVRAETLRDDPHAICQALQRARAEADVVIVCGGLGPTHDDRTREALADCLNRPLQMHAALLEQIKAYFTRRGRHMPERNQVQALVPEGFTPIPNPLGTAPGLWLQDASGIVVVLPGVPHELQGLMREAVLPRLQQLPGRPAILQRTLVTAGIGESELQQRLQGVESLLDEAVQLAYLPSPYGVRLRLTARAASREAAQQRLSELVAFIQKRIQPYLVSLSGETLEVVVGKLLRRLGATVAVAESCTGGHLADCITNVSGASTYFRGGVVAYDNAVKVEVLGVAPELLAREGAVSEAVAIQMARGVRKRLGAQVALATTGIAGPTGGTPDKPVGTVWIGLADDQVAFAQRYFLPDDRKRFKQRATAAALDLLRRHLLQQKVPRAAIFHR
ncbi:competence/damage-inducible protein A [Rhodothermus profundi]|uniref:CinA-like protein n=1 Tax=Rhodothermus profundi TaxID=633813 RepID=A0A1M6PUD3_9BACT|nr:competence/damage-inducible protein A [Rhodothermus profundi]SHK11604.1 competence/damage-inducible protein cinA [Rhodothermus profundi]